MGRRGRGTPRERDSPRCGNHWALHQPSQTSWQSHSCEATTTLPDCGWGRDGPEKQEEIFVKISCVLTVVVAPSQKAAYSPTSVVSNSTDFSQYSIPGNSYKVFTSNSHIEFTRVIQLSHPSLVESTENVGIILGHGLPSTHQETPATTSVLLRQRRSGEFVWKWRQTSSSQPSGHL